MTEPLFFDCLTDAQCWSLFDAGVLHGHMLPVEVYERLARTAPDHGCYLFRWPEGVALPSLLDIVPGLAVPGEEPPAQTHSHRPEARVTVERMGSAIEAFCARVHADPPSEGGRVYSILTNPRPELRAGPRLEPQARDLNAMSLRELEAYLDAVLRVDEENELDSAALSARRWLRDLDREEIARDTPAASQTCEAERFDAQGQHT